ncbi:HNH endonuclease [Kineococcus terrestris]|uniref:HNH endonuclease n=1 Tax=Kineococcus terrestris TaxID=2044856 RepID=UPI0034DB3AAE
MSALDPLDVGARVAGLLATGRRVSTYKLATLSALLQHCLEHPAGPGDTLVVPITDLADRVVELYWTQVRPFGRLGPLRQNEQADRSTRTLLDRVAALRASAAAAGLASPAQARAADPAGWARERREVARTLAQQPLFALQRTGGGDRAEPFLYDDSWLSKKVTTRELDAHGWSVELLPGVAHALARVSGLLQPVVQRWWVVDVQRMNRAELAAPDVEAFLFGADRIDLGPVRAGLRDLQSGTCFYCGAGLGAETHVDHVLPWSRTGIDGLANLVLADPRCNGDKSATLPALHHVSAALHRPPGDLAALAAPLRWPLERERVLGAARTLYRTSPPGTPLWRARGAYDLLDPAAVPGWSPPPTVDR